MTDDTTKNVQRLVDKVKPAPNALDEAREMFDKARRGADGKGHPNWSDDDVAEVLGALLDEHEKLRAAARRFLEQYDRDMNDEDASELRKLVTP